VKAIPPVFMIHGKDDSMVHTDQARRSLSRWEDEGDASRCEGFA
jgi:dipeptidyl aminopeptidase/acylaminoacyl peptidase